MTTRRLIAFVLVACVILGCQPISPEGRTAPIGAVSVAGEDGEAVSAENMSDRETSESDAEQSLDAEPETLPADAPDAVEDASVSENTGVSEGTDGATNESRWSDPALIEAGHQAYRDNYCGVCHRLAVAGTLGPFGPAHDEMGTVAWERLAELNYQGSATNAAEYIRESIVDPNVYLVPTFEVTQHRMPPYTHLDDTTIDAMVAFLLAQE